MTAEVSVQTTPNCPPLDSRNFFHLNSFSAQGYVDVNEQDCIQTRTKSYPYAIVIAPRPAKARSGFDYDVGNLAAGCSPPRMPSCWT
jgi:hypothetical protein